ncbi:MAG: replicative DNA helicase, partial [Bacteroidetes bacterium]
MDNTNKNTANTLSKFKQSTKHKGQPTLEYGKVPPQALDLENAVLGAMMLEQYAVNKVIDILQPDMFYKQAHQHIFEAIKTLFGRSEPVDIMTVNQELKKTGNLDIVGGSYYIMQLTNRIASGANIEFHARIIQQKYIQRELIRISSNIIKDAFDETTDVLDLLDKAETSLFEVAENNLRRSAVNIEDVVKEAIANIEEASKHEGNISGIPSGFHRLDNLTSGWQPSDLVILAARPGMGKTAFVLSLARNVAVDYNKSVALFSLEMSAVQLVTRLISSETEISGDKLRKGNLTTEEWSQLNTNISALNDAKLFIDDTPALSIFELRAKSRRLKSQHDIQMIIIDYLQLMSA